MYILYLIRWWNQPLNSTNVVVPNITIIPFSCATDKDKQLTYEKMKSK